MESSEESSEVEEVRPRRAVAVGVTALALTALAVLTAWGRGAGGALRTWRPSGATGLVEADFPLPTVPPTHVGAALPAGARPLPAGTSAGTPKSLLAESLLAALGARAEKVAPQMGAGDVASTLDAYVQLGAEPGASLLSALGGRAEQVAPKMAAADVAKMLEAYGRMQQDPGEGLWGALQARGQQVASQMGPQDVASALTGCNMLGKPVDAPLLDALRLRASQVAPQMGVEALAETVSSAADMKLRGDALWAALSHRAEHVAQRFTAQEVANTLDAYSELGKQPPKPLWAALGQRSERVAPHMGVKDITHTLKAYARAYETLRRKPGDDMLVALGRRAEHVVDRMSPQDVAAMFSAYAQLSRLSKRSGGPAEALQDDLQQEAGKAISDAISPQKTQDDTASGEDAEVLEDAQHVEAAEQAGDTEAFPLPSGVVLSPQ